MLTFFLKSEKFEDRRTLAIPPFDRNVRKSAAQFYNAQAENTLF